MAHWCRNSDLSEALTVGISGGIRYKTLLYEKNRDRKTEKKAFTFTLHTIDRYRERERGRGGKREREREREKERERETEGDRLFVFLPTVRHEATRRPATKSCSIEEKPSVCVSRGSQHSHWRTRSDHL